MAGTCHLPYLKNLARLISRKIKVDSKDDCNFIPQLLLAGDDIVITALEPQL